MSHTDKNSGGTPQTAPDDALSPPIRALVGAALAATQRQPPRGNSLPRQAPPAIQPPIATYRSLLQPQPPRAPSGRGALRRDPTLLGADRTESTPACWGNRRLAPRRAGAAPGDRPSYSAHPDPGQLRNLTQQSCFSIHRRKAKSITRQMPLRRGPAMALGNLGAERLTQV
jgi:hypothetical protein